MTATSSLLGSLFGEPACDALFDDAARVQAMLEFESALARAQAQCGVIPAEAAQAIAVACDVQHYDLAALAQATALAGNPAIPLVKALTACVAEHDAQAARWVHWGATSQDVIDTGTVLQLRAALDLLLPRLQHLCADLAALAERERNTGLPGRTLLQQAVPVTFGLKVAGWLDALQRAHHRLQGLQQDSLVLQFGGAAGTLASLQERGLEVAEALAKTLLLPLPALPWHTARDRLVEVGCAFGLLAGTLGKIGGDVVLLMQSEVGEVFEPAAAGKGGSSAMPHKRNPVSSVAAIAVATRVPGWWRPCSVRWRSRMSAPPGNGTPNGRPCRRSCASLPEVLRRCSCAWPIWTWTASACARIWIAMAACCMPKRRCSRSQRILARRRRIRWWSRQWHARKRSNGICARSSPTMHWSVRCSRMRNCRRCSMWTAGAACPRSGSTACWPLLLLVS